MLACFVMRVICNDVEKVMLDVDGSTESEVLSQCLQVERANTKSNTVYKKESYNSTSLQDKTITSDNFEFGGEGEMDPTSSVTVSKLLREVWDAKRDAKRRTGKHLCL